MIMSDEMEWKKKTFYADLSGNNDSFIPLTLYPRRGSRGISDIPLKRPRFTKII
jgi:hypothetical protein